MKRWIPFLKADPLVSVVRLQGAISAGSRGGLDGATIAPLLDKAFRRGKPDAVALEINSPGGSPVQSALIGGHIRRLADETGVPVLAFVEDVAASGGYWLAAAADEIIVDRSSVLGSIGVISAGFGAHDLISRYGVERRVHTAGKSKSMLDPFRPEKAEDVERLERILDQIHGVFIDHVSTRRKDRLTDNPDLFTGEIWVGQAAVEVGLADAIGHLVPHLKDRFGDKVRLKRYAPRMGFWQRFGGRVVDDTLNGIEERALYARYGL